MAGGNKIPLWAFGFLYWSLHLTHSLKEQALIQERTQCRPKGLRGPTTGGLNHLRNLSHHYLWQTNHNAGSSVLKVGTVLKTLKAGPARASSFFGARCRDGEQPVPPLPAHWRMPIDLRIRSPGHLGWSKMAIIQKSTVTGLWQLYHVLPGEEKTTGCKTTSCQF